MIFFGLGEGEFGAISKQVKVQVFLLEGGLCGFRNKFDATQQKDHRMEDVATVVRLQL